MSRILYACSAERGYIRNRVLIRALQRSHDVSVIGSDNSRYPVRLAGVVPRLTVRGSAHAYFAGFLGQPLVPFMWARRMRPIILDAFVSIYDTLCLDRQQHSPGSPVGRVSRWLDAWSASRADLVLTDTPASAAFMTDSFGTDASKIVPVPVGADESVFFPREPSARNGEIKVLYVTTYLPLHGVPTVIEAASELENDKVRFVVVGSGMERQRVNELARSMALDNVEFLDWVPLEKLPNLIAGCDIFLGGHFSANNEKARRVIAGKIYQGLAMARPVIVGECEATSGWFTHGENVYAVPMGDATALASAIRELAADSALRTRLGEAGRTLFEERFSEAAIAATLDAQLVRLGVRV